MTVCARLRVDGHVLTNRIDNILVLLSTIELTSLQEVQHDYVTHDRCLCGGGRGVDKVR